MARRRKLKRAGWSLLETLIVITIVGIVATMGFSYMISARPHARLELGQVMVHGVLQQARNKAVSEELVTRVVFDLDTRQLWVSWVDPATGDDATLPAQTLPDGVFFDTSGIPSVDGEVLFTPRGSLVSGGSEASGGTITLINTQGETYMFTANVPTGRFPLVGGNLR